MEKISGILATRRTAPITSDQNSVRPGAYNPFSKKEEFSLAIATESADRFFAPSLKNSSAGNPIDGQPNEKSDPSKSQGALNLGGEVGLDTQATNSRAVLPQERVMAIRTFALPVDESQLNQPDEEGFSYRDYPKGSFLNVSA